tara:strand:- start:127 stop:771 length:645 start_codon:yes stop_codon:yes gene_type:complete
MKKVIKINKLNKECLEQLKNENITVKEQRIILENINKRFHYVFTKICEIFERKYSWYDYNTGYDDTDGHFDPNIYADNILIDSDVSNVSYKGTFIDDYIHEIPTSFLFEDFEEQVSKEYEDTKSKIEQKIENRKQKAQEKKNYIQFLKTISSINPEEENEFSQQIENTLKQNGFKTFEEDDFYKVLEVISSNKKDSKVAKKAAKNLLKYLLNKK